MHTYTGEHVYLLTHITREMKTQRNKKRENIFKSEDTAAKFWVHRIKVSSQEQKGVSGVLCGIS